MVASWSFSHKPFVQVKKIQWNQGPDTMNFQSFRDPVCIYIICIYNYIHIFIFARHKSVVWALSMTKPFGNRKLPGPSHWKHSHTFLATTFSNGLLDFPSKRLHESNMALKNSCIHIWNYIYSAIWSHNKLMNLRWFITLELYDRWTLLRRKHRNSYPFNRSQIFQVHSPHPPHRFWAKQNAQQLLPGRLYLIPTRHPKRHRHDYYSGLKDGGQVTVVTMDVSRPATRIDITLRRSELTEILEKVFTQMPVPQLCCATRSPPTTGKGLCWSMPSVLQSVRQPCEALDECPCHHGPRESMPHFPVSMRLGIGQGISYISLLTVNKCCMCGSSYSGCSTRFEANLHRTTGSTVQLQKIMGLSLLSCPFPGHRCAMPPLVDRFSPLVLAGKRVTCSGWQLVKRWWKKTKTQKGYWLEMLKCLVYKPFANFIMVTSPRCSLIAVGCSTLTANDFKFALPH